MGRARLGLLIGILSTALLTPVVRADGGSSPTTRPAVKQKVAVFPLVVISEPGHEWMGRAAQEGIASAMEKSGVVRASPGQAGNGATDDESIRLVARSSGADFVMVGTIQIIDANLRVDVRVLRGGDLEPVANLRDDGVIRDLFAIEDRLAQQAARKLAPVARPIVRLAEQDASTPAAVQTLAQPGIEWVGAPGVYQSRYFDGDLARELAVPAQFSAETDKYNYRPTPFFYGCGYGYGMSFFSFGGGFGVGMYGLQTAAPVSGW